MSLELCMEPHTCLGWDEFCSSRPPFSIALDGFVRDGPAYDSNGPYRNFNHHDGVSRDDTLSSCAQALVAVRKGIYSHRFRDNNGPRAIVCTRDIDPDSAMGVIVLMKPHLFRAVTNPLANKLVDAIHHMDMACGLWPYPETMDLLEIMNWIFDPYWKMRMNGELDYKDTNAYLAALGEIEQRFMEYYVGQAKRKVHNFDFERIGGGDGWVMVRENGAQARIRMLDQGIHAFVSGRQSPATGKWYYTICRFSDYVDFPVQMLGARLSEDEDPGNGFGGGNNVNGNAYGSGSVRPPETIIRKINELLNEHRLGKDNFGRRTKKIE